jgi:hypothetical protein
VDGFGEEFLGETVEVSLKVAELIDLIETGAVAEICSGYEPPIVGELRELFTRLVQNLNEAADEV